MLQCILLYLFIYMAISSGSISRNRTAGPKYIYIKAFFTFGQICFHIYCTYFIHHQPCLKMPVSSTCSLHPRVNLSSLPINEWKECIRIVFMFVSLLTSEIIFILFIKYWTLYFIVYELHIHVFCPFSYWNFSLFFLLVHFNHLSAIYAINISLVYI